MRWRVYFLQSLVMLLALGFTGRLFFLSLYRHSQFVSQAKEQQNVILTMTPQRGEVLVQDFAAHHLSVAAQSIEVFAVSATPKFVEHKDEYAAVLAKHTGVASDQILEIFNQNGMYMNPLKHGMSKTDIEKLAEDINQLERKYDPAIGTVKVNFDTAQGSIIYYLGGIFFTREYQRVYPEGASMGQLLGFVNDEGNGQYGFEERYDKQLHGFGGNIKLERDSAGNLLSQHDAVAWQNGQNYELTIDRNIQRVAEQELAAQIKDSEAQGGTVIIMDPKTGAIKALASQPSFDPNNFKSVAKDSTSVFSDPAISQVWEPGSIMKPMVMAAAMDQGLVTPQTKDTFPASVTVDGYVINTALRKAYGEETMTQVLVNSDNVAMVWVANKLGNQKMYEYLHRFGLGSQTNIDLENEVTGSLLPAEQWRTINRATMSFGQGIAVTPVQVLTAYSAFANGGKLVKPHVVSAIIDVNGNKTVNDPGLGEQVIKPEVAKQMKDMLVSVVSNGHNRAGVTGYKIAGKTGTAQIPDPQKGGYIEDAYNHSFVGFGPSDDPQYLMLVKIDRPNLKKVGLFAETTAVPLFGRISQFLLNYYQVPPTNR